MGKKARKPAKSVQFDDSDQQIVSFDVPTEIELCVDLFVVNRLTFLLTVPRRIGLITTKFMRDKTQSTLRGALE